MSEFVMDLKTPRWKVNKEGATPKNFVESKRFLSIQETYGVSEKTYEDQVEAAYATANLVRRSLYFDDYGERTDWITPADISQSQTTNCHGYSIVTSEALDHIGVPHYVSFANQHSFIILQTPDGDHTNLIDTSIKQLYAEIDGAVDDLSLTQQIETGNSAGNTLDMDIVLRKSKFVGPKKLWMNFGLTRTTTSFSSSELYDAILMLRSYEPEQGRQVLEAYGNFALAMQRNQFDVAHDRLQPLDGEYPDIDRRNRFNEPTRLVRELARTGRMGDALHDIDVIDNSLWVTQDVAVHLWPPDQRRNLGVLAARPDLIDKAIGEYESIVEDRKKIGRSVGMINGRIGKAKRQWATAQQRSTIE